MGVSLIVQEVDLLEGLLVDLRVSQVSTVPPIECLIPAPSNDNVVVSD